MGKSERCLWRAGGSNFEAIGTIEPWRSSVASSQKNHYNFKQEKQSKKKKNMKKKHYLFTIVFFLCSVIFLSLCAFASRSQQHADAFGEWRWMRLICGLTGLDSFLLLPFSSSSSFFFSVGRHSAKFKPQLKTVKDNQLAFSSPFWRLYNRIHLRISRSSHHLITKCNNRNIPPTP